MTVSLIEQVGRCAGQCNWVLFAGVASRKKNVLILYPVLCVPPFPCCCSNQRKASSVVKVTLKQLLEPGAWIMLNGQHNPPQGQESTGQTLKECERNNVVSSNIERKQHTHTPAHAPECCKSSQANDQQNATDCCCGADADRLALSLLSLSVSPTHTHNNTHLVRLHAIRNRVRGQVSFRDLLLTHAGLA